MSSRSMVASSPPATRVATARKLREGAELAFLTAELRRGLPDGGDRYSGMGDQGSDWRGIRNDVQVVDDCCST